MKKIIHFFLLFCPFVTLFAQNINPIWSRYIEVHGKRVMLCADSSDNVVLFCDSYDPGSITGFITAKYTPEGSLMWKRSYDTYAVEYMEDCVVDKKGDVYVCGDSRDPFTGSARFVLLKYAHNGDSLWTLIHGDAQNITNNVRKLLLDKDGNLILIGNVQYPSINDAGLLVLKISPNGDVIWEATLTEGAYGYSAMDAKWIKDRFVIWGQTGSTEGQRFVRWELDDKGQSMGYVLSEQYTEAFTYRDNNFGIDNEGNFWVGDVCCDFKVVKFDRKDGLKSAIYHKTTTFTPLPQNSARLNHLTFDTENNVYVCGSFYESDQTGYSAIIAKLDQSGKMIWENQYTNKDFTGFEISQITSFNGIWGIGTASVNLSGLNPYWQFLMLGYLQNGEKRMAGVSTLDSMKNTGQSIISTKSALYASGIMWPTINVSGNRQIILAKYPLPKSSSTQPHSDGSPLTIYPNPFQQGTIVAFNYDGRSTSAEMMVSNTEGKLSWSGKTLLQQGENKIELPLSALPSGTYYVTLQTDEARHTVRMVKN